MLDIVIVADFCSDFQGKANNRFVYLAKKLYEKGNEVEIITSNFDHFKKQKFEKHIENYNGIKVTMLDEASYPKNICIKRFISHYFWGRKVGRYLKNRKKPDVVYCAMPTLKAASASAVFCKKNHTKYIIDVQDLWPEAFKLVLNVPIVSDVLFLPFTLLANKAYKNADEIIAVSETYADRALKKNKRCKKGYPIYIGTDLFTFDKNMTKGLKFTKEPNEIWLGYCGTLGASYDLKVVFEALRKYENKNLKFIIMGDGPKKAEFVSYSAGLNVVFLGMLNYQDMCSVLGQCDIVINPIMKNAAQSIINKHADYAASGLPVINTQENVEYRNLVENYNMGFNVSNGSSDDIAVRLKDLCENPKLRVKMGKQSRKCAEELFDREKTYTTIVRLIESDSVHRED